MATTLIDSVLHWRKKLDINPDDDYILNVIRKLSKVPITLEMLEVTHIGKTIRKLSKREDIVGEKAKILLNKWREKFTNQESDKHSNLPNVSKKENVIKKSKSSKHEKTLPNQKQTFHNHEYKHKNKPLSLRFSDKPSNKYAIDSCDVNNTTESSHSLYKYEVKEKNLNYVDYDPHAEISEGYNPECPELFPSDKPVKTKRTFSVETYEPSSVRHESVEKVENDKSFQKHFKSEKKLEEKDQHSFDRDKSKNNSNFSTLKKSNKIKAHSGDAGRLKTSNVKETKCKELCDNTKIKPKKAKIKIHSSEEFTSSEVSFEDCLGFNDIVSLKKSSKSHSSVKLLPNNTHCKDKSTVKRQKNPQKIISAHQKVNKSKDSHSNTIKKRVTRDSSSNNIKCKVSKDLLHSKKELPFTVPKPEEKNNFILSSLPEISPNYYPLPRCPEFYSKKKELANEATIKFVSSRKQKTAVYSGRKSGSYYTEVPSLYEICTRILIENLDAIECVGDADYNIMKPILEKCNPTQLYNIENYNPKFLENTNELWKVHCKRDYKLASPMEHETWRELYWRARDEREKKLKFVTSSISASISKSTPIRQVKLAYVEDFVKPPRDVARRQVKHGTAASVNSTKKSLPVKAISKTSANTSSSTILSSNTMSSSAPKKPKLAPLMAKTLKSLKAFRRK